MQFTAKNMQDSLLSGQPLKKINYSNDGNTTLSSNITLTDDDVFLYNHNEDILNHLDDVRDIINYHDSFIANKYQVKRDYYKGRHHSIIEEPKKELNKPDNRLIINLPKKLVNTFNGYNTGEPVVVKHQSNGVDDEKLNDKIQTWLNDNNYADVFSEWNKQADIYGRSYLYVYLVDSELHMTVCSPRDTIVVYDDTILHKPICAIRYSTSDNTETATLITPEADYELAPSTGVGSEGAFAITNVDPENPGNVKAADVHDFPVLPVIELAENSEREGLFDDAISLIDAINDVLSAKVNGIDSFADAYLVVIGDKLDKDQINNLQEKRLINLYKKKAASFNNQNEEQPSVNFLTPDPNDTTQENFLNRAIDLVYQITQVVNLNDSNFGATATAISGVALLQRYQPMQAKARTKALKMDKALRQMFTILFYQWHQKANVTDLTFDHKQSIPHNVLEEAQTVQALNGQVSDVTKLGYLSGIDDPQKEIERLKQQQQDAIKDGLQTFDDNYATDQQKNGGVANGTDDNSEPDDQGSDQSANKAR